MCMSICRIASAAALASGEHAESSALQCCAVDVTLIRPCSTQQASLIMHHWVGRCVSADNEGQVPYQGPSDQYVNIEVCTRGGLCCSSRQELDWPA